MTASGRQTLTPPRSFTTDWKPPKLISTKWSMKIPVVASSVFHRHAAPPAANVALSISVPPGCAFWPGSPCPSGWQPMTGTRESRGKLITTAP